MTPSAPPTPPNHLLHSTTKTNLTTPPTLHSYWLLATYHTQIHWLHDYSDYTNYIDDMIALTALTTSPSSWLCLPLTTLTEYTISVTASISLTTQTTQLHNYTTIATTLASLTTATIQCVDLLHQLNTFCHFLKKNYTVRCMIFKLLIEHHSQVYIFMPPCGLSVFLLCSSARDYSYNYS